MAAMAILFADVCGSTKIYERYGDEVMCRFADADEAAAAALDMQERVSGASVTGGGLNLSIHVGFHFGPVVEEQGDIFGDAVNLAARMVNLAKPDQVLTTGATVALLSEKWRKGARQVDRTQVKGKEEVIDVFELVWQEAEVTRLAGRVWETPIVMAPGRLVLTQGAHELEVSERHPSVTVGRGDQNDLVMEGDLVSRLHARIECRNGRFSLTDQSTNGTYVADASGAARLVRHDSQVLAGSGTIALGHKPGPGQTDLIRYRLAA